MSLVCFSVVFLERDMGLSQLLAPNLVTEGRKQIW
jgi:hypothetical protein